MVRLGRIRATTGAVVLSSMFAVVFALTVEPSGATDDASSDGAVADATRGRTAGLTRGILIDLTSGVVLWSDDVLGSAAYIVIEPATIRLAGREIEVPALEIIDGGALPLRDGPPVLESGASHVCALEDGVTWETADGGCKDLRTGLVWSTQSMGHAESVWSFPQSEEFVETSDEGGFTDWRLPTRTELETVVANEGETHFAADFGGGDFWSSTKQGNKRWAVRFWTGESVLHPAGKLGSDFLNFVGVREATETPVCGDGTCDPGETTCNCPADCGPPPTTKTDCSNGVDDDCDGLVDCDDDDCDGSPDCVCNNNGICDPGEDCENCSDCAGRTNGRRSERFCCGNGIAEEPEGDGTICDGNH